MDRVNSELKKYSRHFSHLAQKVWLVSSVMQQTSKMLAWLLGF